MFPVLEDVAQELNVDPHFLWQESFGAYTARELRLTDMDIADFQDRYEVNTPKELKAKIERGDIYSHPAWEELIEWEHLAVYRARMLQLQASFTRHV